MVAGMGTVDRYRRVYCYPDPRRRWQSRSSQRQDWLYHIHQHPRRSRGGPVGFNRPIMHRAQAQKNIDQSLFNRYHHSRRRWHGRYFRRPLSAVVPQAPSQRGSGGGADGLEICRNRKKIAILPFCVQIFDWLVLTGERRRLQ